jgi:hypothetical protein
MNSTKPVLWTSRTCWRRLRAGRGADTWSNATAGNAWTQTLSVRVNEYGVPRIAFSAAYRMRAFIQSLVLWKSAMALPG